MKKLDIIRTHRVRAAISVSSGLLSTAHLLEGSKARVYSLGSKVPQWLPSLNRCEEARIVRLREVTEAENGASRKSTDATKGKSRDWLPLLLREKLGL